MKMTMGSTWLIMLIYPDFNCDQNKMFYVDYHRMANMLRRIIFFFLVFSIFLFAGASFGSDVLISPNLLSEVGLGVDWQVDLPLKDDEGIDRIFAFDDLLYVLTDSNHLFCIDRGKGSFRFALQLATEKLTVHSPEYYDQKLWFLVGSALKVLDPAAGVLTEIRQLSGVGGSAVYRLVRNGKHLFVAGWDNRLHIVVADEYWQRFAVTADNDSQINSVIADDQFVIFATKAGNIVSIEPLAPKKRWQVDVIGEISAPIVRDTDSIYVAGEDTKLYKIGIASGKSGWLIPFQAGEKLTSSPVIGRNLVYQYAGINGVYAVDKASGEMVWQVEEGRALIGEVAGRAYVFAGPGLLVVMDNATGQKLFSVNFAGITNYATAAADTIYVAGNGRVASISKVDK